MKTSKFTLICLAAAMLLASCSQNEVRMHTIVHEDGSCTREVSYTNVMPQEVRDSLWADSTGLSQPLPETLVNDSLSQWHTDIGPGDSVTTTFSRHFPSAEQMSQATPLLLNGSRLQSKATLEKRFRWFYTEYTFTEVFTCVGDTFPLPATDYADKETISFWFTGQPNLLEGMSGAEAAQKIEEVEPFVSKWLNDNLFKVCFDYIESHYDAIPHPPVSHEKFVELHDSLFATVMKDIDNILDVEPQKSLHDFFHSDAYNIFFDDHTPLGEGLNQELYKRLNILWLNAPYSLTMPGTVTDTGSGLLHDGTIFYALTGERLIPGDYVIKATSRVSHTWAYLVAILVIALAVFSFFRGRKK